LCQDSGWVPIFNPKDFEEEQKNFRCKDFKLDDSELLKYGKQVTQIRKDLLDEANRIREDEGESQFGDRDKEIKEPTKYRRAYSGTKNKDFSGSNEISEPLVYHATSPKKRLLKSLDHSE
jgi:hypothetical protein